MEQARSDKVLEQGEVWAEVMVEAEWMEIAPGQALVGIVSAQVVEQKYHIR